MDNHSDDLIPIDERKWSNILACDDVKGRTLEIRISKLVMKLVRHLDVADRGTDGAVHWKLMGPKLRHAFQKGGHTFSDFD